MPALTQLRLRYRGNTRGALRKCLRAVKSLLAGNNRATARPLGTAPPGLLPWNARVALLAAQSQLETLLVLRGVEPVNPVLAPPPG